MVVRLKPDDPRMRVGAYVTDEHRLYEVFYADERRISLLNVATGAVLSLQSHWTYDRDYRLVKAAPVVEDGVVG